MNKLITIAILTFLAQASIAKPVIMNCTPTDYPATKYPQLYLNLDLPEAADDQNITNNQEWGRIAGTYVLTADLSDPFNQVDPELTRPMDDIDAPPTGPLSVSESTFNFRLPDGWNMQLGLNGQIHVDVESLVAAPDAVEKFQLLCRKK